MGFMLMLLQILHCPRSLALYMHGELRQSLDCVALNTAEQGGDELTSTNVSRKVLIWHKAVQHRNGHASQREQEKHMTTLEEFRVSFSLVLPQAKASIEVTVS